MKYFLSFTEREKKIFKTYKFCKCNQLVKLWVICCFLGIRFCLKKIIWAVTITFLTRSNCPAGIHLFKANNVATRTMCKIYSKFTIKTPERRRNRSGVFIVNFKYSLVPNRRHYKSTQARIPFIQRAGAFAGPFFLSTEKIQRSWCWS